METQHHDHHQPSDPIDSVARQIGKVLVGRELTSEEIDEVRMETRAALEKLSRSDRAQIVALLQSRERTAKTRITPPELARRWGISPDKVLSWIRNGELRAVNVATNSNSRPRFVIDEKDIAAFEERRANGSKQTPPRVRKRRSPPNVIQFY